MSIKFTLFNTQYFFRISCKGKWNSILEIIHTVYTKYTEVNPSPQFMIYKATKILAQTFFNVKCKLKSNHWIYVVLRLFILLVSSPIFSWNCTYMYIFNTCIYIKKKKKLFKKFISKIFHSLVTKQI